MYLCSLFLLVALGTAPARAAPSDDTLSPTERTEALVAIERALEERYVFPEMRPALVERLRVAQQAGRYDVEDPRLFAERVTLDLRDASHDAHLSLQVDPPGYAAATAPPESDSGAAAFARSRAIRNHYGLVETRLFPGNIRYLKITGFEWVEDETGTVYDDALRFLKDGDAVIIDVRGNGGGDHAAVRYLVSHFLAPDVLEMTFLQGSEIPVQSRTLSHLPAGRLTGKPLYVLIDGQSASAAEAFAYDVRQFALGELVGARTVGAANNNDILPIAPGFLLSVSDGRPVHPVSDTNWEGTGVTPDVETPSAEALTVARSRVLARLSAVPGVTPEALAEYDWSRVEVESLLHPVTHPTAKQRPLAGRYGREEERSGVVEVAFRDGALWLSRPGRVGWPTPVRLSPLDTDGLFALEGIDFLRVRLTGKTLEMSWAGDPDPRVLRRS